MSRSPQGLVPTSDPKCHNRDYGPCVGTVSTDLISAFNPAHLLTKKLLVRGGGGVLLKMSHEH